MEQVITTIDEYIQSFPSDIQILLNQLRTLIREAAPDAREKISWGMATFTLNGNLVHFSGQKKHIGFHPDPSAIEEFSDRLQNYKCTKGTIQLPYDDPLPEELIQDIVRFRVGEQLQKKMQPESKQTAERRPRYSMPEDIKEALTAAGLHDAYEKRPPYQRNDYIGWITRAKRPETRQKRMDQMLGELKVGSVYMGINYKSTR